MEPTEKWPDGFSFRPHTAAESACNIAINAIRFSLRERKRNNTTLLDAIVLVHVANPPDGEDNASIGSTGFESPADVLLTLLDASRIVAKQMGLQIDIATLPSKNQG